MINFQRLVATPTVYAVILAWNQLEETIDCLRSLTDLERQPDCIIVADNGSTDDTPLVLKRDYPYVVHLRSEENLGVAGGYNLGIAYALEQGADYVMIMNNDVVVAPHFITELLKIAQIRPKVGIVQPKIYHYYGEPNRLWIVGARWRTFPPTIKMIGLDTPDSEPFSHVQDLDFAPSCVLLISRPALEKVGMFDPEYFFYFDDWDFCLRVRQAGFKILFAPTARMWHKVSVSTTKADKSGRWWYVRGQSTVRFYTLHKDHLSLFVANVWLVISELFKGNYKKIGPYLTGVVNGYARAFRWTG